MKTLIAVALGAFIAFQPMSAARAQDATQQAYETQKVVYHVNGNGGEDDRAYLGALRNAQNHINAVGEERIELIVVMHGNGLGLLQNATTNDTLKTSIAGLKGQGVKFQVCNNTLVGRDISWENDLYDVWEDDIVPSGVAQLSHLQQQDFTYVKP